MRVSFSSGRRGAVGGGALCAVGATVAELTERYGTPLFVYSSARLQSQLVQWVLLG